MHQAEHSETAAAPIERCFETVIDFQAYPEWSSAVVTAGVRERAADSAVVEFLTDAKLRKVRYVLRYAWEPPTRIWWEYLEGDAEDVRGEYAFEALEPQRTRMTYRLGIDAGRFIPPPLARMLTDTVIKGSVRDLKRRVEAG